MNLFILDKLGPAISVLLRNSAKAKRVSIKISHKGPELVMPNKDFTIAHKFLLSKEGWIRKKLELVNSSKLEAIDRHSICFFGQTYCLQYVDAAASKVVIEEGEIYIHAPAAKRKAVLMTFLRERLLLAIMDLISDLSAKYDLHCTKIKLSNNKHSLGSCSSRAVLSFNCKLVFAPPEILYYVVVHEMCHLKEMNHSPRFWNLVEKLDPNYKKAKLWLKESRYKLQQYAALVF